MEIIYVLIPISIVILAIGIGLFFWATRSGQFDDLESPGLDILRDDEDILEEMARKERKARPSNMEADHPGS